MEGGEQTIRAVGSHPVDIYLRVQHLNGDVDPGESPLYGEIPDIVHFGAIVAIVPRLLRVEEIHGKRAAFQIALFQFLVESLRGFGTLKLATCRTLLAMLLAKSKSTI